MPLSPLAFALALASACVISAPLSAQVTYAPSAPAGEDGIKLHLARSGNEVMIAWEIPPELEVKRFEIYRNTQSDVKGRGRAAAVRTIPAVYLDKVDDENVTYWYWLKITLANDQVINIGPVPTPDAQVWTP